MTNGKPNNKPDKKKVQQAAADRVASQQEEIDKYSYFGALVSMHPELLGFYDALVAKIKTLPTGGKLQPEELRKIQYDRTKPWSAWWRNLDAQQQQSEIQMAQDAANGTNNYQASIDEKKITIRQLADRYGFPLSDDVISKLAVDMKYNEWTPEELNTALESAFKDVDASGMELKGAAGKAETDLDTWAKQNGLDIPPDTLKRIVSNYALGKQDIDSAKQELRNMYLTGAYPAWEKQIKDGKDPYDLAAPYRMKIASMLETGEDQIGMNDPILSKAMQTGKPLYEIEEDIRNDPRWQYTNNAMKTYADMGTRILEMFGLR